MILQSMRNIIKVSILTPLVAILLGGCMKETFPLDGTAVKDQLTTSPKAIEAMVNGIPAALVKHGSISAYVEHWNFSLPAVNLAMETMTGDYLLVEQLNYNWFNAWGTGKNIGDSKAFPDMIWRNYYMWIKSANDIIAVIDPNDEDATMQRYLGVAHAYRAKFYLDLVRMYEFKENKYVDGANVLGLTVPLVDENLTEEQAKSNPRATVEDAYAMILSDLDKAELLLQDVESTSKYEPNISIVYGLKARLYLEMASAGDDTAYAEAATYARQALDAGDYSPLTHEQWESPTTGFNSAKSNSSWMWAVAQASSSVNNLQNFLAHVSSEATWTYAQFTFPSINKSMYNKINANDFRRYTWLDPDRTAYDYKSIHSGEDRDYYINEKMPDYASLKFRPAAGNTTDYKVGNATDIALMRMEEMLFIEMEATAHSNLEGAKKMLNDFMAQRMVEDGTYDCSFKCSTLDSFIAEMMLQKRVEFWGEGIVMFDLKRLNMSPEVRGYKGTNAPMDYRLNCDGRAPFWNFVITRIETANNLALTNLNNPDPSASVAVWSENN